MSLVNFTLSFEGGPADDSVIDLYDIGQAIVGFQRSLAITTHLVLNGKVITQAPSLKGATILALPSEEGSWKLSAAIALGSAIYTAGTAPTDTPLGHLVSSAYDYVVSETLGFHVDYDKTLGEKYEEYQAEHPDAPKLSPSRLDSVIEKCQNPIRDMHRPIVNSETAKKAEITTQLGRTEERIGNSLNHSTYEYITHTEESRDALNYVGSVSSYNMNTYRGRIYVASEGRPISFELAESVRTRRTIAAITESLGMNARGEGGEIAFTAYRRISKSGQLKSFLVIAVSKPGDLF